MEEYQCSYFPGGSAWEHQSGEERNSISPVWLTVVVTIIVIAVLLYQCMRFSAPEGRNCQLNLFLYT